MIAKQEQKQGWMGSLRSFFQSREQEREPVYQEQTIDGVIVVKKVISLLERKDHALEGLSLLQKNRTAIIATLSSLALALTQDQKKDDGFSDKAKTDAIIVSTARVLLKRISYSKAEQKIVLRGIDLSQLVISAELLSRIHLIGGSLAHAIVKGDKLVFFESSKTDLKGTRFPAAQFRCSFDGKWRTSE